MMTKIQMRKSDMYNKLMLMETLEKRPWLPRFPMRTPSEQKLLMAQSR